MKEKFSEKPEQSWLEILNKKSGGACVVHLCENITETEETDPEGNAVKIYEADHYMMETGYREGLEESLETNREVWLSAAKEQETRDENKTLKTRVADLEATVAGQDETINELIISTLGG